MDLAQRLLACLITLGCWTTESAEAAIRFGVFPYVSPAKLIELHVPLRDYLSDRLATQIALVTGSDFGDFRDHTASADYDLILTAPHLGRLAQREAGFIPISVTGNTSCAIFVVNADSDIHAFADLNGKRLALPPRQAIIYHMALQTLRDHRLEPQRDVAIQIAHSHNNALLSVLHRSTPAAAIGLPTWVRHTSANAGDLRELGRSEEIPGFMVLAAPGVPADTRARLSQALFAFSTTADGRTYFANTGLGDFRAVSDQELRRLDIYVDTIFGGEL